MNKISQIFIGIIIICLLLSSCKKKESTLNKKLKHSQQLIQIKDTADHFYISNDYENSYYYFNKLKQQSIRQKDTSYWIYSLVWTAQIQLETEDYTGSESTLTEALSIVEKTNNYPIGKYGTYLTLGNNYLETSEYQQALIYYIKSHETSKILTLDEKTTSQCNIALAYIKMQKYQKAKDILTPLLSKKGFYPNPITYAHITNNLGYCYLKLGDSIKSLKLLTESLKISIEENNDLACINSYTNLSEYYHLTNSELADKYTLKAHQKAKKKKFYNQQLILLKQLIKNNAGNKSKEYALQYLKLNDSINLVRQKVKNQFAKIKYDSKKLEDENALLKTQKALYQEQQKNKTLMFYSVFGIGLIILISIISYFIRKNRREKIKTSYETETRIAKKIHDELANDVYQTLSFGESQDLTDYKIRENMLNKLETIYSRIRNISKENSTIETGSLFSHQLKDLITNFNNDTTTIMVRRMELIKWKSVEDYKKITIYRVLQELLVNMKKHSKASLVIISFQNEKSKLHISYSDNGIGIDLDEYRNKNGIQNMENRIFVINGNITFDSKINQGFKANINIPI